MAKNVREDLTEETSMKRNRVPSAVYLAFRKSDKRLIGIVQIRYKLNDHYLIIQDILVTL